MVRRHCPYLVIKLVPLLQDITGGVGGVVAAVQAAGLVDDGVQVEVGELVVEVRHHVVTEVEVHEILLLPGVHPVLGEPGENKVNIGSSSEKICCPALPAEVDDEKWRELDDVGLLADLPSPLAEITLELLDPLLLQIHL